MQSKCQFSKTVDKTTLGTSYKLKTIWDSWLKFREINGFKVGNFGKISSSVREYLE